MHDTSRELSGRLVHGLARVGLVWAVVVLGALFMTTSWQGRHHDGDPAGDGGSVPHLAASASRPAPRTAGLALGLLVLGCGVTVLAIGAGADRREDEPELEVDTEPEPDLSLALGLGLLP